MIVNQLLAYIAGCLSGIGIGLAIGFPLGMKITKHNKEMSKRL